MTPAEIAPAANRIVLAADTGTAVNTVAVCRGTQTLAEVCVNSPRLHSERLLATVDWVLNEAQLGIEQIDALAIAIGPGSFTGLRIGASTWKGLAYAAQKPLVAVPTLDALSRLAGGFEGTVAVALDARMQEVFGAIYQFSAGTRTTLRAEAVLPMTELLAGLHGRVLCLGDGFVAYSDAAMAALPEATFLPPHLNTPRAAAVAAEANALLDAGANADAALVSPVYLRASQAEQNRALAKKS